MLNTKIYQTMKKSILLFAIIASVFVACNKQKDIDFENQDIYGIWATVTNHPSTDKTIEDTLIYYINSNNCKFISEDSIIIYHGKERYTENSDIGYIKYKYEVVKNEKMILTYYNHLYETYTTHEFQWRPDLSIIVDTIMKNIMSNISYPKEINGLCGKYECTSTENIDNQREIIENLEKSTIEFKINNFILLPGNSIPDHNNEHNSGIYFIYTMESYTATISKKDGSFFNDKLLVLNLIKYDKTTQEPYNTIYILFPQYTEDEYNGSMKEGGEFAYSIEGDKLILNPEFSNGSITFKKIQ